MREEVLYTNIISPRRSENGIFQFMTKPWDPKRTLEFDPVSTPQQLRDSVVNSVYIDAVIESESARLGVSKEKLRQEVRQIMNEMGLEKKTFVIRWLGIIFLKLAFRMNIGILVNEPAILKIRAGLGSNPVLFLPTHRSYADFCVMTYLCFHYDIEFPAVAAGMDFYSMAVLGRAMRDTCAFYIRRSLGGAPLYAAALREYARALVTRHPAPVEFFLEGTRSRGNKAMAPKYGMLSMMMLPLFTREVCDITVVPLDISYDRLMEQTLFAYEHLGVPKPKESTGGFLKALHALNDDFGNIYVSAGEPLSLRALLGPAAAGAAGAAGAVAGVGTGAGTGAGADTGTGPAALARLSAAQWAAVRAAGDRVLSLQRACGVLSVTTVLATVLMDSLVAGVPLAMDEVYEKMEWVSGVLRALGAAVRGEGGRGAAGARRALRVHRALCREDRAGRLRLLAAPAPPPHAAAPPAAKMKGHALSAATMRAALPVLQLQLYVNPAAAWLAPPAVVCLLAARAPPQDQLRSEFLTIRKALRYEYFHEEATEIETFDAALSYCVSAGAVAAGAGAAGAGAAGAGAAGAGAAGAGAAGAGAAGAGAAGAGAAGAGAVGAGSNAALRRLLAVTLWPALRTLLTCADVLREQKSCSHKRALQLVQQREEARAGASHPYCLSLEAAAHCLQGLALAGCLARDRGNEEIVYNLVPEPMDKLHSLVSSVMPDISVDFRENAVIMDPTIPSML